MWVVNLFKRENVMEKVWLKSYPKEVATQVDIDRWGTLCDIFDRSVERFANHKGFTSVRTVQTYAQTKQKVDQFCSFLQHQLGLKKGDIIAIMLPNCLQYPIALLGALQAGLVITNINPLYKAREIKEQLADCEPKAIVVIENFAANLEKALPSLPSIQHIILTSIGDQLHSFWRPLLNFVVRHVKKVVPAYQLLASIKFNQALKLGKKQSYRKVEIKNSDLAFLQYTGGTTGKSKGVMLTHHNIVANVAQTVEWLKAIDFKLGGEVVMTPLPLYHIFSLTVNIMMGLNIGVQNILIANPMNSKMLIKQMKRYPISGITAVNTLFSSLLEHPSLREVDFSSWLFCIGGGAPIQETVARKWEEITGVPIVEAYGLTEASPGVAMNPFSRVKEQMKWNATVGLPVSSTDISIRDENNREVPLGEPGELWVKGPQVMQGYWNKPEETAEVLQDGWLDTGDVAVIDEKGFLRIVDRKKDIVVISGFNVYPSEIENVLCAHPLIRDSVVIGVKHHKTGEALKAFIVKDESNLSEKEIIAFCREQLVNYKVPKIFEFVAELPKSAVGKNLRRELRKLEEQQGKVY